eukprot:g8138.t1
MQEPPKEKCSKNRPEHEPNFACRILLLLLFDFKSVSRQFQNSNRKFAKETFCVFFVVGRFQVSHHAKLRVSNNPFFFPLVPFRVSLPSFSALSSLFLLVSPRFPSLFLLFSMPSLSSSYT